MDEIFRKAAKSALYSWQQNDSGIDDLVNDLWVWYLERPATQEKIASLSANESIKTVKTAALQMLSKNQLTANNFRGKNLYSADSVREALRGESTNKFLNTILPAAFDDLAKQNDGYAEEIRLRYTDKLVPVVHSAQEKRLGRAVKSLTEHVNVLAITAGVDADGNVSEGPGSRHAVFPDTRKAQGWGHSDPTGNTAILLIEHPELRDEYLYEEPLPEFLGGRGYAQSA